ncbi:MAG TPA: HAD family hydrolase [Anaerolineae bacterium]
MTITTILLDLDDTLLGNDMQDFLPPYFVGLAEKLADFAADQDLRQLMSASVQVTMANQDPQASNLTVFMADFVARLGHPLETIQPYLEVFYRETYPQLRQFTTFRPAAEPLVRRLLADGFKVVIATNPLFPAMAIEQRLDWAGIGDYPFALVTTMENSHYSKPNPRYYEEILSKTNSDPEHTWMVGDHPTNDIAPAHSLGLKTWWITDRVQHLPEPVPAPSCDKQGTLADLLAWVEVGGLAAWGE